MTTFNLYVPSGTKVFSRKGMVTLAADCIVNDAVRQEDGGFTYSINETEYYCSAGCCKFSKEVDVSDIISNEILMHKTGLVAFA